MFERSYVIKLTVVLYKVSDFFPAGEPLKVLIRKRGDEILAGLILILEKNSNIVEQVLGDIEVMRAYLELARLQNWLDKKNFEILEKEYKGILEDIKTSLNDDEKKEERLVIKKEISVGKKVEQANINFGNKRHSKIIEILKQGKDLQVKDLKDVFPDVSKRTLRRDFEYLLEKGMVERRGDNNNTVYRLRSQRNP